MFLQGDKVCCAEAEEPADTTSGSGGDYSLTDPGQDVTLDSPSEKSDDEDSGDKSPDEAGSEKEAPDDDSADDGEVTPENISDELLDRAIDLGFAASDIIKFRSLSSLTAAIEQAEATKARLDALEARKSKSKTQEEEKEKEKDEFEQMLEDGYDERTVKALKAADERSKALEAEIQRDRAERANQARQLQFDTIINTLESEYPDTFGKGTVEDLNPNSQEYKNRNEVWTRYHVMEAGYQAAGLRVPPADRLIREAAAAAFSQKTQEIARKKLKEDFKRAGSQTVARSRPAGSRPLEGEEAAIAKTRDFLRKNA